MIDGRPDWFRLSGAALADVVLFDEAGKLAFIEAVCGMYDNALNPDYKPETGGGFVGRAIDRQFDCFRSGVTSYMKLVNANPSGKPKGTQRVSNVSPNRREENVDENEEENVDENRTRQELLRSGFTEAEIDSAIKSVKSWAGISNKTGYLIRIILSQRKNPGKSVSAQQYTQRDYSGEDAAAMQRTIEIGREAGII